VFVNNSVLNANVIAINVDVYRNYTTSRRTIHCMALPEQYNDARMTRLQQIIPRDTQMYWYAYWVK